MAVSVPCFNPVVSSHKQPQVLDGTLSVGSVVAIEGTDFRVRTGRTDPEVVLPSWRVVALPPTVDVSEDALEGALPQCCVCMSLCVPRRLSAGCTDADHPFCDECTVNFLWASFTGDELQPRCHVCAANVDISACQTRGVAHAWPQVHPTLSLIQFMHNYQKKIAQNVKCAAFCSSTRPHVLQRMHARSLACA